MKDGKWHLQAVKGSLLHVNFFRCDELDCIGRVSGDMTDVNKDKPGVDLLSEFLHSNQIWFLYMKRGQAYRTIKALFPFQRAYKHLMEAQFK